MRTEPLVERSSGFTTGMAAEQLACNALMRDGFEILHRRVRTAAGEIDAVAQRNGLTVFVEVKARRDLAGAALALRPKQQARLMNAAEILLGENPKWGKEGVRFDVITVDRGGRVRRIADAFRQH